MTRAGSDHTPLLLDSGNHAHLRNTPHFSFELSWFSQDCFMEMVAAEWRSVCEGNTPMDKWLNKIWHLRRFLKGRAKNLSGKYKKEKERLSRLIDELDIKAESVPLSTSERETLRKANDSICQLRRDEETKWAQHAKVKHIQEGGNNTKYFHLIANGKPRKKENLSVRTR